MGDRGHLVGLASIEVEAQGVDGFRFQREVADWVHERLLPELESVLDGLPQTDDRIVLDRLDLVLDTRGSGGWEERAVSGLRRTLEDALQRKLSDLGGIGAATRSESEAIARGLAHYLEHGALPWNWHVSDSRELRARLETWLEGIPTGSGVVAIARVLGATFHKHAARRRFLSLPEGMPERILRVVFGVPPSRLRRWERDLDVLEAARTAATSTPATPGIRSRDLLEALLEAFSTRLDATVSDQEHAIALALSRSLERYDAQVAIPSPTTSHGQYESTAFRIASARTPGPFPGQASPIGETPAIPEASGRNPSDASRLDVRGRASRGDVGTAGEGFHIVHAGLVLLGPYLPMLFERAGHRLEPRGEDSVSSGDHASAMALLHFLATGRDDPAEFELVLPKVLCGLSPDAPYEGPVALDPVVREEAETLLASVIAHWGALKDSSIDALRGGFLARGGKLSLRDGIWRLRVEQKPWDMLLEQLPWSVQYTKLPWMEHALKTEWME